MKRKSSAARVGSSLTCCPRFARSARVCRCFKDVWCSSRYNRPGCALRVAPIWARQQPQCPYKVVTRNLSGKVQKAKLYVDGQKVTNPDLSPVYLCSCLHETSFSRARTCWPRIFSFGMYTRYDKPGSPKRQHPAFSKGLVI